MMQLRYSDTPDFMVLNKPYDVRTQQLSDGQLGFVDFLQEKLTQKLHIVQRLDAGSSGIMLLAKSTDAAAALAQLLNTAPARRTYLFLSDKNLPETDFTVGSFIQKQNNRFMSVAGKPANSETRFKFVRALGNYFLWEASPSTSEAHQIRLHAEKAKIPVLGDTEHGGAKFFRLALHSQSIEFSYKGSNFKFDAELPPLFKKEVTNETLMLLEENFSKRHELYKIMPLESYRLLHLESPDLRADVMSDRLWLYDYSKHGLSEADSAAIRQFADSHSLKPIIRHIPNRAEGVGGLENTTLEVSSSESEWTAIEENTKYVLKIDAGFTSGLYLDQRENRKWVQKNSVGKSVLDLFCFTAGFSINAALGAASEIVSVDVDKKFLDWGRENFVLNGLNPESYEFVEDDCVSFLKSSIKAGRKWDLIICDPPSFARKDNSISRLEQDLPQLAKIMVDCLNPGGTILFTCSLEFSRSDIEDLFLKNQKKAKLEISRLPMLSLDFELVDDLNNPMKGFFVTKPN